MTSQTSSVDLNLSIIKSEFMEISGRGDVSGVGSKYESIRDRIQSEIQSYETIRNELAMTEISPVVSTPAHSGTIDMYINKLLAESVLSIDDIIAIVKFLRGETSKLNTVVYEENFSDF